MKSFSTRLGTLLRAGPLARRHLSPRLATASRGPHPLREFEVVCRVERLAVLQREPQPA